VPQGVRLLPYGVDVVLRRRRIEPLFDVVQLRPQHRSKACGYEAHERGDDDFAGCHNVIVAM
jgi:hypothetical protein